MGYSIKDIFFTPFNRYFKSNSVIDNPETFKELSINAIPIISKIANGRLVCPEFIKFKKIINEKFYSIKNITSGSLADYIPQLSAVNPDLFALSFYSIDGQHFSIGDTNAKFSIQSTSKPISYCIALENLGLETVHQYVGREPSGTSFNQLILNNDGLPHNPMINAGAIMMASLIKSNEPIALRYEYIMSKWTQLFANKRPGFMNAVYLSEKSCADRNYALGYMMREHNAFPENTNLIETLEFYLQCCSLSANVKQMSMMAATLANSGVQPLTFEKIFHANTTKHCLSLMLSCGMYDYSGEFAFTVGLPAKSGVSGIIVLPIPNFGGFAIYSPRLDELGNSVRGVEMCKQLVKTFNLHLFDSLLNSHKKIDPRINHEALNQSDAALLCWAAASGELLTLKQYIAQGLSPNIRDYDGRTPLHVAASEGQAEIVRYLIESCKVNKKPIDRWNNTPMDDAIKNHHIKIVNYLKSLN